MNIILGKIGQKIIFNRDSKDCDRSNTNGNVGTYLLFKLLIENNPHDNFFVVSENDLNSFKTKPYENVFDASHYCEELLDKLNIDTMFILSGLTQFEKGDRLFNIINNLGAELILLADDPRCLDSVSNDNRLTKKPMFIISQFAGRYNFKGLSYRVPYIPIERAACYKWERNNVEKDKEIVIISNTSGKEYDRVKIVAEILNGFGGIDIYGRLSDEERKMLGEDNCKGEVKFDEMQNILSKAYSTLVVPIKKGWVTSKYIEALMNGVLPIFYNDYNTDLLQTSDLIVVKNSEEFFDVLGFIKDDKKMVTKLVNKLTKELVEPFVDGKILSELLMFYACLSCEEY